MEELKNPEAEILRLKKEIEELKYKLEKAKDLNERNIAASDKEEMKLKGKIEALHEVIDNLVFELKQ